MRNKTGGKENVTSYREIGLKLKPKIRDLYNIEKQCQETRKYHYWTKFGNKEKLKEIDLKKRKEVNRRERKSRQWRNN